MPNSISAHFLCDRARANGDRFRPCAVENATREVILEADAAQAGFGEIGGERFPAHPWDAPSGTAYVIVALPKDAYSRHRGSGALQIRKDGRFY